jgi:hypothetical protein
MVAFHTPSALTLLTVQIVMKGELLDALGRMATQKRTSYSGALFSVLSLFYVSDLPDSFQTAHRALLKKSGKTAFNHVTDLILQRALSLPERTPSKTWKPFNTLLEAVKHNYPIPLAFKEVFDSEPFKDLEKPAVVQRFGGAVLLLGELPPFMRERVFADMEQLGVSPYDYVAKLVHEAVANSMVSKP